MRLRDLAGKRVVIWGGGRECRSLLAAAERTGVGFDPTVLDESEPGVDVDAVLAGAEVLVKSPGVSRYRPEIQALRDRGVPVTTATNLWFAEPHDHVIGVTGTKGKSTTSSLIAALLNAVGLTAQLAGNIGRSPIEHFGEPEPAWWVLELSSFQTSDLERSPDIGVFTTFSPEHLDWHHGETNYAADKLNLFAHNDAIVSVVNYVDPGARALAARLPNVVAVGEDDDPMLDALQLQGRHNRQLARLALAAIRAAGVDTEVHADALRAALSRFEPLPHRLNPVAERNGVTYIDDSLSTTPISAMAALDTFADRPVTILLGGYDRGVDYSALVEYLVTGAERVAVVTMPDSGRRIGRQIREAFAAHGIATDRVHDGDDLDDAVRRAAAITPTGGVVLLSPAAPSFGAFRDYAERSAAFLVAANCQ